MLITDFGSLIELIKEILPFAVCILTFIGGLYLYKIALKTNRKNPLIYLLAGVSVFALYFGFIEATGLGRYDYFFDGLYLFLHNFEGLLTYAVVSLIAILSIAKTIDLPLLVISIFSLTKILFTFVKNAEYLILKAKYICALVLNFLCKIHYTISYYFGYICNAIKNIHILNCVYNC